MKKYIVICFLFLSFYSKASFVLLPMEAEGQKNHLKAYGITYWALNKDYKAKFKKSGV